jgi:flagellum-specific peptidoglycan hydrolase FlgJ
LINKKNNNNNSNSNNNDKSSSGIARDLGPRRELIDKRQEQEQREQSLRLNRPRENVSALSEAERARRLREMEEDAHRNDSQRLHRLSAAALVDSKKGADSSRSGGNASFLGEMRTEAYVQSYENGIKQRLDQNRHYSQRGVDMETDGFLKKK